MIKVLILTNFLNMHVSLQLKAIQPILGTMTFSDQTDKQDALAMLETFISNGFSMIGTLCFWNTETSR